MTSASCRSPDRGRLPRRNGATRLVSQRYQTSLDASASTVNARQCQLAQVLQAVDTSSETVKVRSRNTFFRISAM